jgi:hypothetical protein
VCETIFIPSELRFVGASHVNQSAKAWNHLHRDIRFLIWAPLFRFVVKFRVEKVCLRLKRERCRNFRETWEVLTTLMKTECF